MKPVNRIANHQPQPQPQGPNMTDKPPIILHAPTMDMAKANAHKLPAEIASNLASLPCSCCRDELAAFEPTFLELRDLAIRTERKLAVLCPSCAGEVERHLTERN